MTKREDDTKFVHATLKSLMVSGTKLDAALTAYARIKDARERAGLCHDIAVSIMLDLDERGAANGWTWCRGTVDGGLDHSWVEYGDLRIDMGDEHKLRTRFVETSAFAVHGAVQRRDAKLTLAWVETVEALDRLLRGELAAIRDAWHLREAALIVSGSPVPVPVPHQTDFDIPPAARIGLSVAGLRGVAHGFSRALTPEERARVEALFPDHLLQWIF